MMGKIMAKRTFYCKTCLKEYQRLIDLVDGNLPEVKCKVCQDILLLKLPTIYADVKEVIDNGIMPRRVERFDGSDELFKDRERNARIKKHTDEL